jgi:hypothetical protein
MTYSQKQLFEIAKKLLIFSGKKWKTSAIEKKKLIPQLTWILEQVQKDWSNMSLRVQKFLKDIIWDIENDRIIDIDEISEDNYIENYLQAEQFVQGYNSLLKQGDYIAMVMSIESRHFDASYTLAVTLKTGVKEILTSMQTANFSRLLLIIKIFKISQILKSYSDLYVFSLEQGDLKSAEVLLEIITFIRDFHAKVHAAGFAHIQNNTVESIYMRCDIKNNKLSFSPMKIASDETKEFKYKKILLEIFSI